jgi:MgsA AAA+ ATPase C terminal
MGERSDLRLPDGTPLDEATSALIKTLRRGEELEACYWAAQMAVRFRWKVWRTLATFAAEDVGMANPLALPMVMACRQAWENAARESSSRPPVLLLAHAVITLARSPKNREASDLAETVKHLVEQGWRPDPPGYAVDSHTERGRDLIPREDWLQRWLTVGSVVEPDTGPVDWRAWIMRWAVGRGRIDRDAVEAQIEAWDAAGRLRWGVEGYPSLRDER